MLEASNLPAMLVSAIQRWLHSWRPSRRLGIDPQQHIKIDGRYVPVSIANWKLIEPVARRLLSLRKIQPLTFEAGKVLTVVIPFRDREPHLAQLIPALRAQLDSQHIDYRVLVVEQTNAGLFNRGRLLNVGVHFAAGETDYFCLHDVDAVPLYADYRCPSQPLRLVHTIVSEHGESRREGHYFSGAVSIRKEQILAANGFSNEYWGWGKEDDDFFFRLLMAGYLCYFDLQGRFEDLPNPPTQQIRRDEKQAQRIVAANRRRRSRLLRGLEDPSADGLSTLKYELVRLTDHDGYRRILIRW